MASRYVVQVAEIETGELVASWPPGLSEERNFIARVCDKVRANGVGLWRSEAHVVSGVVAALSAALHELKAQVR